MSNKIIQMSAPQRRVTSALDEFLPEIDLRGEAPAIDLDPGEIHLEPVGFHSDPSEAPLGPIAVERSKRAQLWPMLAAAFVGIGVTVLAFAAFSSFAQ